MGRRRPGVRGLWPFQIGVTSGLRPVPAWKSEADFVFVQVSHWVENLLGWRESVLCRFPSMPG